MSTSIWFITGISSGLGQALAQAVMQHGEFVIGTFREQAQADTFNAAHSGKGFAYVLDVTNGPAVQATVAAAVAQFRRIDVLVNNAGFGFAGAIEEVSESEARAVMETNFFGALHVTQAVLPLLRQQRSGHIVQVSSHGGVKSFAGFGMYNAAKFALEGFSEALAQEIAPLGIKLTIVEPGPFRTGFASKSFGEAQRRIADYDATAGAFRQRMRAVNGQQEGDPTKAAEAIFGIVSSDAPPLRLPLGKVPLSTIQLKIDSLQKDLNDGRGVAESVVFEA